MHACTLPVCQRQVKATLCAPASSACLASSCRPVASPVEEWRSSREPRSLAWVKHSFASTTSHAFRAASPTIFHLCSTSACLARSSAMSR